MDRMLITKVRADLAVAHGYFDRVLGEVAASAAAVADSHALNQALDSRQSPEALRGLLDRFRQREGLDFVRLIAPDGRELAGQWREDQPPAALPPEMQATVRAHAERMVALSHPGAKVCRNVPVGIVQVDVVRGTVLAMTGGQVRIRIESVGTFSNQMDGRVIAKGDELLVEPDDWFPCR